MEATFCEFPGFHDEIPDHFGGDEEFRLFQIALMANPTMRDVIPGAGGIRKVRWPGRGHGKRGGLRIIYLHVPEFQRLLLIDVYFKGEQDDLTVVQRARLADYAERYVDYLRGRRRLMEPGKGIEK